MRCTRSLQALAWTCDGVKRISFKASRGSFVDSDHVKFQSLSLPCGKCMSCRLERSREWAVRIMHEAQMYKSNSFVTLTFDEEHLKLCCLNGSLDRRHMKLFLDRFRIALKRGIEYQDKFGNDCVLKVPKLRVYYSGEYGDENDRPHYHICMFGVDFPDKEHIYTRDGKLYYKSEILRRYWSYGNNVVADLTFESAAYVARYCTKKLSGEAAKVYEGRLPPFGQPSLKPGIGATWIERYGKSDLYNTDRLVIRGGITAKSPRYYDKLLEKQDPEAFAKLKARRYEVASDNLEHPDRAFAREVIVEQRSISLKRKFHDFN